MRYSRLWCNHRRVALSHHQSRYTAVTVMHPVVYICISLYAIHHFASLFLSTTINNNLYPKVRVEYSCGSVEYTTTCSTAYTTFNCHSPWGSWVSCSLAKRVSLNGPPLPLILYLSHQILPYLLPVWSFEIKPNTWGDLFFCFFFFFFFKLSSTPTSQPTSHCNSSLSSGNSPTLSPSHTQVWGNLFTTCKSIMYVISPESQFQPAEQVLVPGLSLPVEQYPFTVTWLWSNCVLVHLQSSCILT